MEIVATKLEGVLIIEPDVFADRRGFFMETYNLKRYRRLGIDRHFVQDNLSFSVKNTLRGLHYQTEQPQAKLVQVISGEVFDVAVDVRAGSSTFGQWTGIHLSDRNRRQVFIPEGFAHGFCVLSPSALFAYKCSAFFAPEWERGILWSDADIAIHWPIRNPIVSDKDLGHPRLSDCLPAQLPGEVT